MQPIDFFRSRIDAMINLSDPLAVLATHWRTWTTRLSNWFDGTAIVKNRFLATPHGAPKW